MLSPKTEAERERLLDALAYLEGCLVSLSGTDFKALQCTPPPGWHSALDRISAAWRNLGWAKDALKDPSGIRL